MRELTLPDPASRRAFFLSLCFDCPVDPALAAQ